MRRVCRKLRLSEGWWPLPGSVGGLRSVLSSLQSRITNTPPSTHYALMPLIFLTWWKLQAQMLGGLFCFFFPAWLSFWESLQVCTRQIPLKKALRSTRQEGGEWESFFFAPAKSLRVEVVLSGKIRGGTEVRHGRLTCCFIKGLNSEPGLGPINQLSIRMTWPWKWTLTSVLPACDDTFTPFMFPFVFPANTTFQQHITVRGLGVWKLKF